MFKSWLDLRVYTPGEWVVLNPFEWRGAGRHIVVPRGFVTDLASIPIGLRNLFNINGKSREPAVLHDWLYCAQRDEAGRPFTRREADDLFRAALGVCGVRPLVCNLYWSGVQAGGWRYWNRRGVDPINADDFAPPGFVDAPR